MYHVWVQSGHIFVKNGTLSPPVGSLWFNILRGLLEVLGGMVGGVVFAFLLRYFPSKDQVRAPAGLLLYRSAILAWSQNNSIGV